MVVENDESGASKKALDFEDHERVADPPFYVGKVERLAQEGNDGAPKILLL